MTKQLFIGLLLLAGLVSAGCNKNHRLTGKVTFTDGNPVTSGMVIFSTATFQAKGTIQSDGSYTAGSEKINDGIPKGTYQVHVTGVEKPTGPSSTVPLCEEKYFSAANSGLTCTVPAPGNKYDLVLEPHPRNYP